MNPGSTQQGESDHGDTTGYCGAARTWRAFSRATLCGLCPRAAVYCRRYSVEALRNGHDCVLAVAPLGRKRTAVLGVDEVFF